MDKIYKKNDDFVYRKIAGETLLVPIRNAIKELQSIYSFNETACYIWENIDGKQTLAEIVQEMKSDFALDNCDAQKDIEEFIGKLKEIGAIQCLK